MSLPNLMDLVEQTRKNIDFDQMLVDWQLSEPNVHFMPLAGKATIDRTVENHMFWCNILFGGKLERFGFRLGKKPISTMEICYR